MLRGRRNFAEEQSESTNTAQGRSRAGGSDPAQTPPTELPDFMCTRGALSGGVDPSILCPEAAESEPQEAAAPVVTPGMVLEAFEAVALPEAVLQVQPPDGRTLVNLDTNFFTTAEPFTETVTLLGQVVELDISATGFAWDFGDGATHATSTPGAAYPDLEVTHAYTGAGTVSTGVTITWSARFRVDGGAWAEVPGTVTMTSAGVPLEVLEATPVLTE
ncbi:hypothetical protein RDV89_12950 [Nocardioides zeae]|uniref:PKD domain-containing protein n=1 Tax=Nocardioides imazamoxiresistens TaxID=3231893 RepID=A0ABU3PXK6_9ACTN|nr:hypothetical protein [Nocardioides zeae]MDT9593983.1 hypothetical protein [Nocardioides zeae]